MSEDVQILNTSDEAAKQVGDISGWVDRHGRYWGNDERAARYAGCTHVVCDCGKIMEKGWLKCQACREVASLERFLALEPKQWDHTTPLCIHETDTYFFTEEDLLVYIDDHGCPVQSMQLRICEPVYLSEVEEDHWCDELAEDGELPSEIRDALKTFNAAIRKQGPVAWTPGKYAAAVGWDSPQDPTKRSGT